MSSIQFLGAAGTVTGSKYFLINDLNLDLNVGYRLNTFNYNSDNELLGLSVSGAFPNLGFGIGYTF